MHPDIGWAIERNARTAREREGNAFAQLAALGQNHGRPLLTAPLTRSMRTVVLLAARRGGYVSRIDVTNLTPRGAGFAVLRGIVRRQYGDLVVSGGQIIGLRLNNSGRALAARLSSEK